MWSNRTKLPYIEKAYQQGLNLSISVQFIKEGQKMTVLSASINSDRIYDSCDYAGCMEETTLIQLIKDYLGVR